jgi:predicted lipid-binding transport protein (Tim44 family)
MTETVLVAIIAAFGVIAAGLPAALIERARRENATDHAFVRRTLEAIDDHLNEIEDSLDEATEALIQHIDDEEAHRGDSGRTSSD